MFDLLFFFFPFLLVTDRQRGKVKNSYFRLS